MWIEGTAFYILTNVYYTFENVKKALLKIL